MSERKFEFTLPTRIIFQPGCIRQVGVEALQYRPRRALLVTDPGVLAAGIAQKAADSLQSVGIPYQIFSDLSPNPRDYELDAGGRLAREAGIDLIVAVGGGSALDAAKAIGVLLTHPGCILDWCGSGGLDRPIVPLIAVPTTAGTGSEVTPFSVVTNSQTHIKQCVWDLRVAARVALLDSELLSGLPAPVMAATGIDALTHAVEAYTCTQATPFTDPLALRAITLVSQNLRQAVDTHAPEACAHMLLASNLAGIAFAFSDVAAVHTMAEALGGRYDLPHGQANAMLLCTVSRHNIPFGEQVNTLTPLQPENGWATVVGQAGAAIWWFIGFEFVCPTAEENKRPHKNIPRALIFGVITIVIFDLLFAYASVRYTDLDVLMTSTTPHIATARALIGPLGWVCMTVITLCAAFTSVMVHLVALPRLLYGLAYKDCAPKIFMYLHPKFRTPWVGIFFTSGLILVTLIYIQLNGADVNVILGLVNIASVTWMCSYGIALIDVLVLRRRYPDYPRLTRFPGMPAFMCIGLVGLAYCIWTLRSSWLYAGVALVLIAAYCVLWLRHKKLSLFEPQPLEDMVSTLMARAEPYPEWDQAVTAWLKQREQAHV